jgi:flagellar protein FlaI
MDIPTTMVENLDTAAIVRRLVVDNVSIRRMLEVSEIIGWDNKKNDFRTHQVFRWDAKKDVYSYSGTSYLLKEIAGQWGYSVRQIEDELETRRVILDYMVRNNIRTYDDVSGIIMDYFADRVAVYRKAKVS